MRFRILLVALAACALGAWLPTAAASPDDGSCESANPPPVCGPPDVALGPPEPPSDVYVVSTSKTTIMLSWMDNAVDESRYEITRARTSDGVVEKTITVNVAAPGDTEPVDVTDKGLLVNTGYTYSVSAVNGRGYSAASTVTATTRPNPDAWVVVLCKFAGDPTEPHPRPWYVDLFTEAGAGKGGMLDYWRDQSYGKLDLTGTFVTPWVTLPYTRTARPDRVQVALDCASAAEPHVHFPNYGGFVVMVNAVSELFGATPRPVTLDGETRSRGFAFVDPPSDDLTLVAHEMAHGLGLGEHSRSVVDPVDYRDGWDLMSAARVYTIDGPFGKAGPNLMGYFREQLGWMPPARINVWPGCTAPCSEQVTVAALSRPDAPGALMVKFGSSDPGVTYTLELRTKTGWDGGIRDHDAVLIHEVRSDAIPYLASRTAFSYDGDFIAGQTHRGRGDVRITIDQISPLQGTATVSLGYGAPPEPQPEDPSSEPDLCGPKSPAPECR